MKHFYVIICPILLLSPLHTSQAQDLHHKIHTGYQGWFTCEGDQAHMGWHHWGKGFRQIKPNTKPNIKPAGLKKPTTKQLQVDFFPDLREYDASKLYLTGLTYPNGQTVKLFSSNDYQTVDLHFKWMRDYGIDGVFLQRFLSPLKNKTLKAHRDRVLAHVIKAAKKYKRKFAIMYDLSGYDKFEAKYKIKDFKSFIKQDWYALNRTYKLTSLNSYMHENQRPVLAIWGLGFSDRSQTKRYANDVLELFRDQAGQHGFKPAYLIAGVPSYWRHLDRDSESSKSWKKLYLKFDMLSPWSVGRYKDQPSHDHYLKHVTRPDITYTTRNNTGYMPVIFPGFSWGNLKASEYNQIPRLGGRFFWRQVIEAKKAGANCLYVAMFDEVDEGTAIFKCAENASMIPAQGRFITLDADGEKLPSDWYLRLTREAGKVIRGEREIDVGEALPIKVE